MSATQCLIGCLLGAFKSVGADLPHMHVCAKIHGGNTLHLVEGFCRAISRDQRYLLGLVGRLVKDIQHL